MKVRTTVNVTKSDMLHGIRGDCRQCPVALSLERKLGQRVSVSFFDPREYIWRYGKVTGREHAYFRLPPAGITHHLPPKVARFIQEFDTNTLGLRPDPKPFGFTLIYDDEEIK